MKAPINLGTIANQPDHATAWILKLLRAGHDVEIVRSGSRRWWYCNGGRP